MVDDEAVKCSLYYYVGFLDMKRCEICFFHFSGKPVVRVWYCTRSSCLWSYKLHVKVSLFC